MSNMKNHNNADIQFSRNKYKSMVIWLCCNEGQKKLYNLCIYPRSVK